MRSRGVGDGDAAVVDVNDDKQVVIRKQVALPAEPALATAGVAPLMRDSHLTFIRLITRFQ